MYSTKEIILGIHYKLKIYVLKNKRTERTKENFQKNIFCYKHYTSRAENFRLKYP